MRAGFILGVLSLSVSIAAAMPAAVSHGMANRPRPVMRPVIRQEPVRAERVERRERVSEQERVATNSDIAAFSEAVHAKLSGLHH